MSRRTRSPRPAPPPREADHSPVNTAMARRSPRRRGGPRRRRSGALETAAGLLAAAGVWAATPAPVSAQEDPPPPGRASARVEDQRERQPRSEPGPDEDPAADRAPGPPATERRAVTETIAGEQVLDPFRWLEGDTSEPLTAARPTPEVERWTDAQNAYTRSVLDALPGRTRLAARIRELMEAGSIGVPIAAGDRVFYRARSGRQALPILYAADADGAEPRALLDPFELDAPGPIGLDWFRPSPDGELVAFGLRAGGDGTSTLHVLDAESGRWLADQIAGRATLLGWMPAGRSFFYARRADPGDPYSTVIAFHEIGDHPREDRVLLRQRDVQRLYADAGKTEDQLEALRTTRGPFARPSADGRWLTIGYHTDAGSIDLWTADLDAWRRTGELGTRPLIVGGEGRSRAVLLGDDGYLLTHDGSPNGRVVRFDPARPDDRERWQELVPERRDTVITDIDLARGVLLVTLIRDASAAVERYTTRGRPLGEVPLPGSGTARISAAPDRTGVFLRYESFDAPARVLRFDAAAETAEPEVWRTLDAPLGGTSVVVNRVRYTSADGTEIGMFIVHREGLELSGDHPTLLTGFGGFGVPMLSAFDPALIPWIERGGVFALPNLRGGGERGLAWHDAGRLNRKQNVFDDFIAAGEWLINNGYTRPERLAIAGRSNGGLLAGAVVTQRPDLFSAAFIGAPLLDMLRYDRFLAAGHWTPEYGSPDNTEHARALLEYSPYHNIEPGTRYPAVLLTASAEHARVHPMHARKMAARLQAATSANPDEHPVLLWIDPQAGHGGEPLEARVREAVDRQLFLMWQTGLLGSNG